MPTSSALQPIHVLFGKNTFQVREALRETIRRELDGGDSTVNLVRFDGAHTDAATVLDEVRTMSLFGERRVVVVEGADAFITRHREVLERYVQAPSDWGCLVLVGESFDSRTRLFKAVAQKGRTVKCEPLWPREVPPWLIAHAERAYGKRLAGAAATRLLEHVGPSQEALDAELSKLAIFVGQRGDITAADVETLVADYHEENVFAVCDALAGGRAKEALELWHQVLATDRAASARAIGGLAWAVRRLLQARCALDGGASAYALAKEMRMDAAALTRRLQRWTRRRIENLLADLMQADLNSKTGLGSTASQIERLLVKHAAGVAA